jgi:hypothetical protein
MFFLSFPLDFSGPLASSNPNTGNNSKPIGFQNRFDAFDKRKPAEDLSTRSESAELYHSSFLFFSVFFF